MKDLVIVKTFNSRIEAEVAKGLLESNNIACQVSADDEGGMAPYPFQPTSSGVNLLVDRNHYDKATKILNE